VLENVLVASPRFRRQIEAMTDLWAATKEASWRAALDAYDGVVAAQGVARLPVLDAWYQRELPVLIRSRSPMHVALDELARLTEWKMARGEWRARNLVLVRGNDPDAVVQASTEAFAAMPHPTKPIARIAELDGVGPATASAVVAAIAPAGYPFFDELVAAQVPGLGIVKWTHGYYAKYATALRERADALGHGWTASAVERALWAHAGGKAKVRAMA
jgi:hypothetical protein